MVESPPYGIITVPPDSDDGLSAAFQEIRFPAVQTRGDVLELQLQVVFVDRETAPARLDESKHGHALTVASKAFALLAEPAAPFSSTGIDLRTAAWITSVAGSGESACNVEHAAKTTTAIIEAMTL